MKLLVKNISKHIGEKEILKDISIELESGKVYGFVGKNGSGKTMLFSCLLYTSIGTILGYSAMAGSVGGGGLGDIAIRYGYYRCV